jgi:hypothetical protein
VQEGTAVAAVGPRDRGHSGQGADAGAAGEAEQDRLGLVVAGVAEEDRGGAMTFGGGVQGGVPGVARGGLGASVTADGDGDRLGRGEPQLGEAQHDFVGAQLGAGLQTVVDGDATGADAEFGGFEGEGGGECHGVGAAGAGDEHERRRGDVLAGTGPGARAGLVVRGARGSGDAAPRSGGGDAFRVGRAGARGTACGRAPGVVGGRLLGQDVVEYAADRQAYRRDRRMGTHVRFPS